nr:MAG TPA: hypothetical protein [Caudoviricetes sp.]
MLRNSRKSIISYRPPFSHFVNFQMDYIIIFTFCKYIL